MTAWRLHPEPGSKWYLKGPHWRVCNDSTCPLDHVSYAPFRPIYSDISPARGLNS